MFCQNCGNRLDDDAIFCDVCGTRVEGTNAVEEQVVTAPEVKPDERNVITEPEIKPAAKKSRAVLKIAISIVILVAVIAAGSVAVLANVDKLPDSFRRVVQSDEEYYVDTETKMVQTTVDQVTELYSTLLSLTSENPLEKSIGIDFGMSLSVDQKGKALLETLIKQLLVEEDIISYDDGLSLDSLSSVSVDSSMGYSDAVAGILASFSYGSDRILSAQIVLDLDEQKLYVEIPELNKKAMMIDMSYYLPDMSEIKDMVDMYMEQLSVLEDLPDEKVINKFVTKYIETALNCIEDVETEKTTLEVSGVKVKCNEYTVSFSEKDVAKILIEVMDELLDDEDFEEICISYLTAACELECMNDSWYSSYIEREYGSEEKYAKEQFEYALEEIEESRDFFKKNLSDYDKTKVIKVNTYIDSKGKIIGREISLDEELGDFSLFYCEAVSGSKQGFELNCEADGYKVSFSGNGSYSKNLLSGEYALKVMGASVVGVSLKNFDTESIKKGYINGSVEITPNINDKLIDMLDEYMYLDSSTEYILEQLSHFSVALSFEMNENGVSVTTVPSYNGTLGSLKFYVNKSNNKFSVPKSSDCVEIEDEDDVMTWLKTVDVAGVVKSIRKIEIIDEIASLFDVDIDRIFDYIEGMDGEDIIDLLEMFY